MARHTFIVFTNPLDDSRDEEFNRWYDDVHLGDVVDVPGILSAQRFSLSPAQIVQDPETRALSTVPLAQAAMPWRYAAIYEIETDDIAATFSMLTARAGSAAMALTDAMAPDVAVSCYQPLGEKVYAPVTA